MNTGNDIDIEKIKNLPHVYWINMDVSVDRRKHMEKQFDKYGIGNTRIIAVNGKNEEEVSKYGQKYLSEKLIQRLKKNKPGERGCLLSHLKALEEFYSSGNELGLIMEDDVSFEFLPKWKKSIKTILENVPIDFEILQLCYILEKKVDLVNEYSEWNNYYSTAAYVIKRPSVEKLFQKIAVWDSNEIDENTISHIETTADKLLYSLCKTYTYKYSIFTYCMDFTSYIHSDHVIMHKKSKRIAQKMVDDWN